MKEINIGRILSAKRREKGATQEEVAAYIGVSKAAVSKWETNISYPDITLLPQLAAYFNISIDELVGYEPQMTKEDIKRLYHRLASDFGKKPFQEVEAECEQIIHKYYSCFPLLLQMGILLMNHSSYSGDPERICRRVLRLCGRIRSEESEIWICREALLLEANVWLMLKQPQKVMELLGEHVCPYQQNNELLAMAYQMTGNMEKADEVLQICAYQNLIILLGDLVTDIAVITADRERTRLSVERALKLVDIFGVEQLHTNSALNVYMSAAQFYAQTGEKDRAFAMLAKYVECCGNWEFPVTLHGDGYFNRVDGWLEDFELGKGAPCSSRTIRQGLLNGLAQNPALAPLKEEARMEELVRKLENMLKKKKGED